MEREKKYQKDVKKVERREELIKRFNRFDFVPGHGPKPETMTEDELEEMVDTLEYLMSRPSKSTLGLINKD